MPPQSQTFAAASERQPECGIRIPSCDPRGGGLRGTDARRTDIVDKIRIGHSLTINCGNRECLHLAKLDLEDIAARLGADLAVADLVARAVCAECGARWAELSISVSVDNAPRVVPDRRTK
jgi:hypothetical protein